MRSLQRSGHARKELTIDAGYVSGRLSDITRDQDLSRYIL